MQNKEARAAIIYGEYGDALLKEERNFDERQATIYNQLVEEKVIDKETYEYYKRMVEK